MERIEHLILHFHEEVTQHLQPDGSCVLRRADCGRYAVVSPSEWSILSSIDGTKSFSDLVRQMLERHNGLGLRALLDRIATLRADGFLEPGIAPVSPEQRPGMLVLGPRLKLPEKIEGKVRVWPWIAAVLLSFIAATAVTLTGAVPKSALNGQALLVFWVTVAIILSVRSIAAVAVLAQAGTRPWRAGIAWNWWVLHLWIDARDVLAAGRLARISLSLAELTVAILAVPTVFWLLRLGLIHAELGTGALAGAAATLWWMLRPFGISPLAELVRLLSCNEMIWEDTHSYLSRKLLRRIVQREDLPASEMTLTFLVLVYPLWGYACLVLFSEALDRGFLPALAKTLGGIGKSRVEAVAMFSLFAAGLLFAVGVPLISGLWWVLRRWQEGRSGQMHQIAENDLEVIVRVLMSTPLFATLPLDTLEVMAHYSSLIDLPDHAFAVRKGTWGDSFFIIRQGRMAVIDEHESGRFETVAELSAGDAFGEMALLGDGYRTATVQALGPCQVISIPRNAFQQGIEATGLRQEDVTSWLRLAQRLRHSPLFEGMSATEVARFLKRARRRQVALGEIVIREGDPGDCFYMILSGRFEVRTAGRLIATLGPGDFMGEIALLASVPRTATVAASERSDVLELGRNEFLDTLTSDFTFGLQISETAHRRLGKRS